MKTRLLWATLVIVTALPCLHGQLATIQFATTNSSYDNQGFLNTMESMKASGEMGDAQYNFLNNSYSEIVTVNIGPTNSAHTENLGNGHYTIFLNNAPGTNYLSETEFNRAMALGEAPPNRATTVSHETAHVQGATNEMDATANYENEVRNDTGVDLRDTYNGETVANQTVWQAVAAWFKSIWKSSNEEQPPGQDPE